MYDMRKVLNVMAQYNGWNLTDKQMSEILLASHTASDNSERYNLIHSAHNESPAEAIQGLFELRASLE